MVEKVQKILITGSEGMLGQAICAALKNKYRIYKSTLKSLDITKKDLVFKKIKNFRPDFIIHAAAYTDVDGCELNPKKAFLVNVKGTENIVDACKKYDIKLIFISTDYVFNGKKKSAYVETDIVCPLNIYGSSKFEAERIIEQKLEKFYLIRTSWLYGKGGKNFVDTIIAKAKKEKTLSVVSDQIGAPTYAKDLAYAILRILDFNIYAPYGIYNITNDGSCSWFEFAKEIIKIKRIKAKVLPILSKDLTRPAKRPNMSLLDNSKFNKFCDLSSRPYKNALCDYIISKAH
ncbi:MAG: dTDP-4-dehydrorhamnose reductase [Patescibacteria group bacterium]